MQSNRVHTTSSVPSQRLLISPEMPEKGVLETAGSKITNVWNAIPHSIKLPIATALLTHTPLGPKQQAIAYTATACLTIPRNLLALLTNCPINFLGYRIQPSRLFLQTDSISADLKDSLTVLDQKIASFERSQPPASAPLPIVPIETEELSSTLAANRTSKSIEMERKTDAHLQVLIDKASLFGILKIMHGESGIEERNAVPNLLRIADLAYRGANEESPSVWKLFTAHYGKKLSWLGWMRAGCAYLLLWNLTSIVPKIIDSYLKSLLSELRIHLKENGEQRTKLLNGFLEDVDNFFEIYNGAAETYATDSARKGNLNRYRKTALNLYLQKEETLESNKTPEAIRIEACRKLSASIMDNFAPNIPFRFAFIEKSLNPIIRFALKKYILPDILLNASLEGQEATKQHNIPFFLALARTLTGQIAKVQQKLADGSSDIPSASAGMKNFESVVKKLMRSIDLADCKTPEEMQLRLKELENRMETPIQAHVRGAIQLGLQKGFAALFDYLSNQENTEELFSILFESLIEPLSGKLPLNPEEWAAIETEYRGATILLKQSASSLLEQMTKQAIEDKIAAPEKMDRIAQIIFSQHKMRAEASTEQLCDYAKALLSKLNSSIRLGTTTNIYAELSAIVNTLKVFENEERIQIALNQDPPPRIAELPHANQESILRILQPIYRRANQVMDLCSSLQELQKELALFAKISQQFGQTKQLLKEIETQKDPAQYLPLLERLDASVETISSSCPEMAKISLDFKIPIGQIAVSLKQLVEEHKRLESLNALLSSETESSPLGASKELLEQLALSAQGKSPRGFKKWKCLDEIKTLIGAAVPHPQDQQILLRFVEQINQYNTLPKPRPDFEKEIWAPIASLIRKHKERREDNCLHYRKILDKTIPSAINLSVQYAVKYENLRASHQNQVLTQATNLEKELSNLHSYIQSSEKEFQVGLSPDLAAFFGFSVPGTLFALLRAKAIVSASFGMGIGAFIGTTFSYGVQNLASLGKESHWKFGWKVLTAATISGLGTGYLTSLLPFESIPEIAPWLAGATLASMGLEYAAASQKRLVNAGVRIAMPKVDDVFDKAYEHLLKNDLVMDSAIKILMKQVIATFPPKS